jgi:hypothetical protein
LLLQAETGMLPVYNGAIIRLFINTAKKEREFEKEDYFKQVKKIK